MSSLQQQGSIKLEGTDVIEDLTLVKKYSCNLCGLKFTKKKFLLNHFSFCKNIENPDDGLGADPTTAKKEEIESPELVGEQVNN